MQNFQGSICMTVNFNEEKKFGCKLKITFTSYHPIYFTVTKKTLDVL